MKVAKKHLFVPLIAALGVFPALGEDFSVSPASGTFLKNSRVPLTTSGTPITPEKPAMCCWDANGEPAEPVLDAVTVLTGDVFKEGETYFLKTGFVSSEKGDKMVSADYYAVWVCPGTKLSFPEDYGAPVDSTLEASTFTVVDITITPTHMSAIESKDSDAFTATVTPEGLNPTFKWTTTGAWPEGAGNSPALDYAKPTEASTIVKKTRWFAPTNNRRQNVDGLTAEYSINCEVTIDGDTLTSSKPGKLGVSVDMTGITRVPRFSNEDTIVVRQRTVNDVVEWYVDGIGQFSRIPAEITKIGPPPGSQFRAKIEAHENKHLHQFNEDARYKDYWNAQKVYNEKLKDLTAPTEAELKQKINAAVTLKDQANRFLIDAIKCTIIEKEAYDEGNGVEPDFLELDDADWKELEGCP